MHRFIKPVVAVVCIGGSGVLGVVFERLYEAKSHISWFRNLQILHAKDEGVDEIDAKISKRKLYSSVTQTNTDSTKRNEIMRFGYPSLENIKYKDNYVLSYNRRLRQANWVCEHLNSETLRQHEADRTKCDFHVDQEVHPLFRATNRDFRNTGYDRGHLAASANHRFSQEANCQTFFLSNISPQVGSGFNRDTWEHLEKYVRQLPKSYKNVHVLTGPLFLPKVQQDGQLYVTYKVIGNNRVAVPTHFFKVIVTESYNSKYEMQCYILPNQPISEKTPLHKFQVPVGTVEKASGLVIFENLPSKNVQEVRPTF